MQKRILSGKVPEAQSALEIQLEANLKSLTDELILQQAAVETAMSEKSMYMMRLEAQKRGRVTKGNKISGKGGAGYGSGLLPFTAGGKQAAGVRPYRRKSTRQHNCICLLCLLVGSVMMHVE